MGSAPAAMRALAPSMRRYRIALSNAVFPSCSEISSTASGHLASRERIPSVFPILLSPIMVYGLPRLDILRWTDKPALGNPWDILKEARMDTSRDHRGRE